MIELHSSPAADTQTGAALRKIFSAKGLLAIVVITESLKTEVAKLYAIDANRIIVCPDAADDLSRCVPKQLDGNGRVRVGYLGSLQPGKGMEIIAKLPALCPDVSFHVVGGSSEQIEGWRLKLADQKNIVFYGHVPPAETGEYLAAFDIALAPNQDKVIVRGGTDIGRFTSPMKLFEYMSAGRPIIASDLPVLREVLHHDRNAWLCDPTSPETWRDAIMKLARDPAAAMRLAGNARTDFEQYWSWDARAQRLLAIVNDAEST
jgi:glycosyltransferase involved in cell wall biosynthesis